MSSDRFQQDSSGNIYIPIPTGKKAYLAFTDGGQPVFAGVVASSATVGNTGPLTNVINYTPPKVSGKIYRLSGYVDITAWTTPVTSHIQYSYTDASGTAQGPTDFFLSRDDDTNGYLLNAVHLFYAMPVIFTVDNSGTAITVSTTVLTGSPNYNMALVLERMN